MSGPGAGGIHARLDDLRRSYRALRADLGSPLPTVRLDLGRTLPAWSLRLLLLALGVGVMLALQPGGGLGAVLAGVLVAVTVRPTGTLAAVWCGACGLSWALLPGAVGPQTFVLLAVVPAVAALAGTLAAVPLRARVEWAALRPGLIRYALAQGVSQPIVAAALAVQARHLNLLGVAVAAAAAVAILAWLLLPRLGAD